ncbi:MAG: hypothetical protein KKH25_00910 [Candidatus Omnitrophica bacterium]|nr:hypothetical protein [Candidatus Omnitrophota bacterium]
MKHKAQSFMDYAALIVLVCISLLIMSSYVFRSIDTRMAHIQFELFGDPLNGIR